MYTFLKKKQDSRDQFSVNENLQTWCNFWFYPERDFIDEKDDEVMSTRNDIVSKNTAVLKQCPMYVSFTQNTTE